MSRVVRFEPLSASLPPAPAQAAPTPLPPAPAPHTSTSPELTGELAVVAAWSAWWLLELPAAVSLLCEHGSRRFLVTTSQRVYESARRAGRRVMHGEEWSALCNAAELGRACLAVEQWLVPAIPPPRAPEPPDWTLPTQSFERALGAWPDEPGAHRERLSVAGVLAHFGAVPVELDPAALDEPSGLL